MDLMKTAPRPSTRLNKGNVLLANAQVIDTKPVKARLTAFTATHRSFIEVQAKVDEAEELERAEAKHILRLDADQDEAVETIAVCLINEREPRRNPFTKFSEHTPSDVVKMAYADEAKAIHTLVETVRRDKALSNKTHAAADAAQEAAALKMEEALPGWDLRRAYLAAVRQERDNLAEKWDLDYAALRRLAQSVIETPTLVERLFRQDSRILRKAKTTTESARAPSAPATARSSETKAA